MLPLEKLGWLYRGWQESISSNWQLQVRVFGAMLIIVALAMLSTSYLTHSWPFESPGAQSPHKKVIKTVLNSTSSQNSHAASSSPEIPNTPHGTQLCADPDGDGTLVPCKLTFPIDQFSAPTQ